MPILCTSYVLMFLFYTLLTYNHDPSPRHRSMFHPLTPPAPAPIKYLSTSGNYHRVRVRTRKKCPARATFYRRTPRWKTNNIGLVFPRSYRFIWVRAFTADKDNPSMSIPPYFYDGNEHDASALNQFDFDAQGWVASSHHRPPAAGVTRIGSSTADDICYDSDSFKVAVDNCASVTMTHCKEDLLPDTITPVHNVRVRGVGGYVPITHKGTVNWRFEDDNGRVHEFLIPNCYLVPHLPQRILSPQHWAQGLSDHAPLPNGTRCVTTDSAIILQWKQRRFSKTVKLSPGSNIGIMRSAPGFSKFKAFEALIEDQTDVVAYRMEFQPFPAPQAEHQSEHQSEYQSEHQSPSYCQPCDTPIAPNLANDFTVENFHVSDGEISQLHEEQAEATDNKSPRAVAYWWHCRLGHLPLPQLKLLARAQQIPATILQVAQLPCAACIFGKSTRRPWRTKGAYRPVFPATKPGECVSVDQLKSSTPGFVAQLKGILTTRRYTVSTVFVDHFSDLSYVHFSSSDTAVETLAAKHAFERYAASHGVTIQHYHCDNGRFAENVFLQSVKDSNQRISFCPVNKHAANGKAEKRIRDLQDTARTILLHATARWPSAIMTNLWPYALKMANDVRNQVPRAKDGRTPIIHFSGSGVQPKIELHTFGCPVYPLNSTLAAGKSIPKWDSRARLGIYLGQSPVHSRTVALVLNPITGHVSPQFHIKFDDAFATVSAEYCPTPYPMQWRSLAGFERPADDFGAQASSRAAALKSREIGEQASHRAAALDSSIFLPLLGHADPDGSNEDHPPASFTESVDSEEELSSEGVQQDATQQRTSGRTRRPTQRLVESRQQENIAFTMEVADEHMDEFIVQQALRDPIAFKSKSDPDTLYYHQAMQAEDHEEFRKSAKAEIDAHTTNGHWQLTPKSQVPSHHTILPAIWAFKRKRRIATGEIYKWKARINIHGGKQIKGVHYDETYSPVVTWASIRTLLTLSQVNKWATRQIDFVQAFPQADARCEMYMEIPRGFEVTDDSQEYCLKIIKNLYGSKNAGLVFHEYLKAGLAKLHFVQSKVDEGVFYRGKLMFLIYIDDGIIAHPDKREIDKVIRELRDLEYDISDEGDIGDYLGVKVDALADGCIKLSQPLLMQQICNDLGFNDRTKTKSLPALSSSILHRDLYGAPFSERWDYRSVIGKLNFLEKSTRPDISYAVHQCARFMSEPRDSHAQAIKQIVRYVLATSDKGLILQPENKSIECYADADFSGNWEPETAMIDPSTARSRSAFIITFAGCPLIWTSKLQTEIALSSAEAEFICLSQALREVIPLIEFFKEIESHGIQYKFQSPIVYCKLFEDNSAALEIARVPKMRPRTKHINIKYHHFREYVKKGIIKVLPISTEDQLADIGTKPLPFSTFVKFRELLMKWSLDTS